VREALADYGVATNAFGAATVDRLFAKLGANYLTLTLVMRNALRKRVRFVLTLLTLASGGLFFMTALNVRESMINSLDHLFGRRNFDLTIFLSQTYPLKAAQKAIAQTPGIARAEGWLVTRGSMLDQGGAGDRPLHEGQSSSDEQISVVAMPADTQLMNFDLIAGRAFNANDTNALIMNSAMASKFPSAVVGRSFLIQSGGEIKSWQVIGVTKESFSPPVAYTPISPQTAESTGTNSLKLKLLQADEGSINTVAANLDQQLSALGIRAIATSSKADSRFGFDQHMLMIYIFLIIASAIIALVGGLGLMTTMSLNVLERRREMGVLRAIGATPSRIWRLIVGEALVIGVLSWVLSALLSWPVTKALGELMVQSLFSGGLEFKFDLSGVLIWLGISLAVSFIGSFLPAWRASKLTVHNALVYE
jgi:putative ABC transport system permease protein